MKYGLFVFLIALFAVTGAAASVETVAERDADAPTFHEPVRREKVMP
jgi:hypothetical protein